MNQKIYYTAIGCSDRRKENQKEVFYVVVNQQEFLMDPQEILLWTCLDGRILREEKLLEYYGILSPIGNVVSHRTPEECIRRLQVRGLIASGRGSTDYDALYNLMSGLTVMPVHRNWFTRWATFLYSVCFLHYPIRIAKEAFRKDERTRCESAVMDLVTVLPMRPSEIIHCVEHRVQPGNEPEQLAERIYDNDELTMENIVFYARGYEKGKSVIEAISNLYLRRQILFERL